MPSVEYVVEKPAFKSDNLQCAKLQKNEPVESKTDPDPNAFALDTNCSSTKDEHLSDDDTEIDVFEFHGIDDSDNEDEDANYCKDIKTDVREYEDYNYFRLDEETNEDLGKHEFENSNALKSQWMTKIDFQF